MSAKVKRQASSKREVLGHRVEPEVKEMLQAVADKWHQPQREVLESAVRGLYRAVFRKAR